MFLPFLCTSSVYKYYLKNKVFLDLLTQCQWKPTELEWVYYIGQGPKNTDLISTTHSLIKPPILDCISLFICVTDVSVNPYYGPIPDTWSIVMKEAGPDSTHGMYSTL